MKNTILSILLYLISFETNAQDLIIVNPQLHKNNVYRDIENVIYLPNIDQKKYTIKSSPECKIEKMKYVDESGISYTCFKLSQIPDVKFVTISLSGQGKSYGNFRFNVLANAPKK